MITTLFRKSSDFYSAGKLTCYSTRAVESTQTFGEVILQKLGKSDKRIAVFGLNRPKAKNALGHDLIKSIKEATQVVRDDKSLSVVIFRSHVAGVFCAGADLKERYLMSNDEVKVFVQGLRRLLTDIEDLEMPTIAAIDGYAVGGGLELALACDLRTIAHNAKVGLVETSRSLLPGAGGTQRLPRSVNLSIAKELIFTSRLIDGFEAEKLGVVNHAVNQNDSSDAAYQRALDLAREININSPLALRYAKQAIVEGIQGSIADGYIVEQKYYELNIPTEDRIEGMLAFKEKRKPVWKGK